RSDNRIPARCVLSSRTTLRFSHACPDRRRAGTPTSGTKHGKRDRGQAARHTQAIFAFFSSPLHERWRRESGGQVASASNSGEDQDAVSRQFIMLARKYAPVKRVPREMRRVQKALP